MAKNNIKIIYPSIKFMTAKRTAYYDYLLKGFKDLKVPLEISDDLSKQCFNQGFFTITAINIYYKGEKTRVWYDWSDFQRAVHPEIIGENDLYFKVECNLGHIYRYYIQPIGQSLTHVEDYFSVLPILRKMKNKKKYEYDIMFIGRATSPKPNQKSERILVAEKLAKTQWNNLIRINPAYLRPLPNIKSKGSLDYISFLNLTATSKINLLLPGIGELTWRISETLGIGACALMPKISTLLPGNPKNCWIEVKRDYSDLIEKVNYYLTHDKEREQIAKNGLRYYNKWLSPKAQAYNIIRSVRKNAKRKTN